MTDLQRRKLTRAFNMFDANHNGILQPDDFATISGRLLEHRRWSRTTPEGQFIVQFFDNMWQQIAPLADAKTGGLPLEVWLKMWDGVLADPAATKAMIDATVGNLFRVLDENGDGVVTREEAHVCYRAYGVDTKVVDRIFDGLGMKPGEALTLAGATTILTQFYQGTDATLPGNWMYGEF